MMKNNFGTHGGTTAAAEWPILHHVPGGQGHAGTSVSVTSAAATAQHTTQNGPCSYSFSKCPQDILHHGLVGDMLGLLSQSLQLLPAHGAKWTRSHSTSFTHPEANCASGCPLQSDRSWRFKGHILGSSMRRWTGTGGAVR